MVLSSLPFENAKPKNNLEYAVYDYRFQMRKALLREIKRYLFQNSRIFYTYSKRAQKISPLEKSNDKFSFEIIDERKIENENYLLYLIKQKNSKTARPCSEIDRK